MNAWGAALAKGSGRLGSESSGPLFAKLCTWGLSGTVPIPKAKLVPSYPISPHCPTIHQWPRAPVQVY